MADIINLERLIFSGKHGVHHEERSVEQEFEVSLSIELDIKKATMTDKLSDTVDYQVIKDEVQKIIETTSSYLIENLAENIAKKILVDKRIKRLTITIKKISVWSNGIPSVTIVRENS